MLSPDFNRALAANHSDMATRPLSEYGGTYNRRGATLPSDGGTAHFSVVDGARNAVAMTSTINTFFGSKVLGRRVKVRVRVLALTLTLTLTLTPTRSTTSSVPSSSGYTR